MSSALDPFVLSTADSAIVDLHALLDTARQPERTPGEPWGFRTDPDSMKGLAADWRHRVDWRTAERELNAFPQYSTPLDGIDLHFLRVEGNGPSPTPLLLVQG